MKELDYKKVFERIVDRTRDYVKSNSINCLVLGISGGIDSTVVAAIAREVCDELKIPFIGRSLMIKNKMDEVNASRLVGGSFCTDFKEVYMKNFYRDYLINLYIEEYSYSDTSLGYRDIYSLSIKELEALDPFENKISNGNIMARLRMSYLYDLAGRNKGLVLDTDNLTEHYLGFWTIHGDEGDFNPIGGLWKTEVYGLANYISNYYRTLSTGDDEYLKRAISVQHSISLIPTDGNGISSSDLEQIGGKDYFEVDKILIPLVTEGYDAIESLKDSYSVDTINRIYTRYRSSEYKRRTNRTIKITREELYE